MARPIVIKFGACLEAKQRCILHRSWVGYICTCTRALVQMCPLSRISETDCAEIWYVVRDPVARLFAKVKCGAQLYVRNFFRILETAEQIALKFDIG